MSVDLTAKPQENVLLSVQLGTTDTGLFPQALVYNINDLTTIVATVNLLELSTGNYAKTWKTPDLDAKYHVRITVYTDSYGGTILPVDRPAEQSVTVADTGGGGMYNMLGAQMQEGKKNEEPLCLCEKDKVEIVDRIAKSLAEQFIGIRQELSDDKGIGQKVAFISDVVNKLKDDGTNRNKTIVDLIKALKMEVDLTSVEGMVREILEEVEVAGANSLFYANETKSSVADMIKSLNENNNNIVTEVRSVQKTIEEADKPMVSLVVQDNNAVKKSDILGTPGDDKDMQLAIELLKNPSKLKTSKISKKVLENIIWLKRQG